MVYAVFPWLGEYDFFRGVTRSLPFGKILSLDFFSPSLKELPKYFKSELPNYLRSKEGNTLSTLANPTHFKCSQSYHEV